MNDKDDKVFERLAIVAAVISFVVTVATLIAAGSPRKGKALYIILFFLTFIGVCVTYFLSIGIYKALKWSYTRYKFAFRLMVVLSSLMAVIIGLLCGIRHASVGGVTYFGFIRITNSDHAFWITFALYTIYYFVFFFATGQILYLARQWFRGGKNFLRQTTIISLVSAIFGGFGGFIGHQEDRPAPVPRARRPSYYDEKESIFDAITEFFVNPFVNFHVAPNRDTVIVGALCFAGVWLIYFSVLWVYRARPNENKE